VTLYGILLTPRIYVSRNSAHWLGNKHFYPDFISYKFNSRQVLVSVPLEEKKDKDNQTLHDKGKKGRRRRKRTVK
jgi:hypothetical protein